MSSPKIKNAVVTPDAGAALLAQLRRNFLVWVGVVGSAMSIFGALDSLIRVAVWIRYLAQQWSYIAHFPWVWLFKLFDIQIPAELAAILTASFFLSIMLFTSTSYYYRRIRALEPSLPRYLANWVYLIDVIVLSAIFSIIVIGTIQDARSHQAVSDPESVVYLLGPLIVVFSWMLFFFDQYDLLFARLTKVVTSLIVLLALNYFSLYAEWLQRVATPPNN